jgi:hypothetical protein
MAKKEVLNDSGQRGGTANGIKVEVDPKSGDRILRRITSRDPLSGNPTCVVEQRRASVTNRLLFYSKKTLHPLSGEVISETGQNYSKGGKLVSRYEKTPTSTFYIKFDRRTGVKFFSQEEELDPKSGKSTFLVERMFDRETGEPTSFWGTTYDPETVSPISALHETFKPETGELTLHEEYKVNPETKELELVQSFVPPLEI